MGLKVCAGFSWMVMANESQRGEQNHGGENRKRHTSSPQLYQDTVDKGHCKETCDMIGLTKKTQ